jgi:preprotein translocase subunit SecE
VTLQNNGNEQEQSKDAVLAEAVEDTGSNGAPTKRRGRAARRRRRLETQATLPPEKASDLSESSAKKDAPTPGRRQKERLNIVQRATRPITDYFKETVSELRKVSWPTRDEAVQLSSVVLGFTAFAAVSLGLYSFLLDRGLELLLNFF